MTQQQNKLATRQQMKKYAVFTLMFAACGFCLWLIFQPSDAKQEDKAHAGFNTMIPDPEDAGIVSDKKTAYEMEQQRLQREAKMRTLEEYSFSLDPEETVPSESVAAFPADDGASKPGATATTSYGKSRPRTSFEASDAAYRQIGQTLGSFYDTPREDEEKESLRKEVEELRQSLALQSPQPSTSYEEQVALLEKSYELAAKYMPDKSAQRDENTEPEKNGKAVVVPVGTVERSVVSALQQPQSDSVWLTALAMPRREFSTPVGEVVATTKNTIKACVDCDQTLIDGQGVRLRLQEEMRAGNVILPRNTLIVGTGKIQGERLDISITSLEYCGTIIPVELTVYDSDGQQGIYIPNSMEISAAKEVAANMGQNLGTTVSITNQSAGDQLLSELGKGAIQGASQYISKKIRTVKVHLKEGYRVMIFQNKN